jgi:hypothetical protein
MWSHRRRRMKYIGYGVLTMLVSLYLGSWLLTDVIPDDHWLNLPVFITAFFVFVVGVAMFAVGVDVGEEDD